MKPDVRAGVASALGLALFLVLGQFVQVIVALLAGVLAGGSVWALTGARQPTDKP